MDNRRTRQDWMDQAEAASRAADQYAAVAAQHEAVAARAPWSKSNVVAMEMRTQEAKCRGAAASYRQHAFDVR